MRLETTRTATVNEIKALRERTGVGVLEAKTALEATGGDFAKAEELISAKARDRADKLSEKTASNGLVTAHANIGLGIILTVNCETDFVAKTEAFQAFSKDLLARAVKGNFSSMDELSTAAGEDLSAMSSKFGEKIAVGDYQRLDLPNVGMGTYHHYSSPDLPAKMAAVIGFTVERDHDPREVSRTVQEVAMQVVATNPEYVDRAAIPSSVLDSWGEEFRVAAEAAGRPGHLIEKIVNGQVQKRVKESVLLEQEWLRDPERTVASVATAAGINIVGFISSRV